MKDEDSFLSVCATATLELGIDIGKLERAFQIDAPFTVSGFLQRMGRTGRRGNPSEMWFVMREDHPEPRALFPEMIPWRLIQGIALVQLYLEERFVEPPEDGSSSLQPAVSSDHEYAGFLRGDESWRTGVPGVVVGLVFTESRRKTTALCCSIF